MSPGQAADSALARIESWLGALLDWCALAPWRHALATLLLAVATILPGLTALPVTDRDEARFAQASKQMLETGDLIDIRFQDKPRWKKPVGIYWLQAGSAEALGEGAASPIWAYRVPSALAAVLASLLVLWAARPMMSARAATLAGLMTATTLLLVAEGHIAKTDAALAFTAVVALGALVRLLLTNAGWSVALAFWLAIAGSILLKGPIVPVIVLLALIWLGIAQRRIPALGRLRPLWGIPLAVVLVAPWLIAIWQVSEGQFFAESVGRDLVGKLAEGQEKHWGPPGLYLALVWLTFWPWAALLPGAVVGLWARRREDAMRLLVGWVVPFWIVLEATPTKLPHYVLPLYPALILAIAAWAGAAPQMPRFARRAGAALILLPALVGGVAVIALPVALEGKVVLSAALLGAVGIVAGILAARAALSGRLLGQIGASMLAALALYPAILQFGLPSLVTAFPSPRLAAAVEQWRPCASGPAFSVGYREPSLVFLTETGTRLHTPSQTAKALQDDPGTMVLVENRWRPALDQSMASPPPPLLVRAEISYFNYNRGKHEIAQLLTREDARWAACDKAGN